jgi:hypothetical protein
VANSGFYYQPKTELTEKEKLLADLIMVSHRIPCGYQIAMPMHINKAIDEIDKLFTTHKLPNQEELITGLGDWQVHILQGNPHSQRCDNLMQAVIQEVNLRAD